MRIDLVATRGSAHSHGSQTQTPSIREAAGASATVIRPTSCSLHSLRSNYSF